MSSPPSTNPACKAMGIRTNRETSLQLYFIWGMIDAAIYPLMRDSSNTGINFRSCLPHEEKEKKKKSFALARRVKNLYASRAWASKFLLCLVISALVRSRWPHISLWRQFSLGHPGNELNCPTSRYEREILFCYTACKSVVRALGRLALLTDLGGERRYSTDLEPLNLLF
ncbi:hypothetical protein M441DRAFT_438921 [Trichoderma asperellum CBS 433.97]|uniref:Uncharacterized protein n=1 Tax=Trichoderma asperellum (strain ATCC 204424 / CBS 433.97 / NBRC 101777) TaxID=1042311 RepID=A0A2T3Z3W6_TRIA4|nr:hypothetical protein M441DRAFT_438921 [Trichoderma asperellum CBS 433.97]PTB39493.1 hypothetical protein M441DRAFT_438921 [Trichoderma asperellum CBS 433.97]